MHKSLPPHPPLPPPPPLLQIFAFENTLLNYFLMVFLAWRKWVFLWALFLENFLRNFFMLLYIQSVNIVFLFL